MQAGPHVLGVAFLKKPSLLLETARQPYQAHFNSYRHPRIQPAVYSISIIGPTTRRPGRHAEPPPDLRVAAATPGRGRSVARQILASLMRRAYRRPVTDADLQGPLALYRKARADGDFDAGIEMALRGAGEPALPVPRRAGSRRQSAPGTPIASAISSSRRGCRSSCGAASRTTSCSTWRAGKLHEPVVLERQVRRMLADARSEALVTNFAAQWLHLRNLDSITPDMRLFPDFDDNLRQAFRQETELFFESILREDRSVLDLLRANYTFVNERLAKHYGIPHVYGSRFRRVTLDEAASGAACCARAAS